jgi:transmembrane sensor
MGAERAGRVVRDQVAPAWDDARAARVQQRVLAELAAPSPRSVRTRNPWITLVAAACLATALAVVVWAPWTRQAALEFVDGSTAQIIGDGQVRPALVSDEQIELEHVRGTVVYDVTPRPNRSFVVRAGGVTIRVLGTAFRVSRVEQKVTVEVQRGRVEVTRGDHAVRLAQGERVVLDDSDDATGQQVAAAAASSAVVQVDDEIPSVPASALLPVPPERSAAELFRAADDARASGDAERAIQILQELVREHPRDARVAMARFTMGRLHMQQGRAAQAAQAFESCGQAFGGEAWAEAALARSRTGDTSRSKALAERYLQHFPDGPRAGEMARLAGR